MRGRGDKGAEQVAIMRREDVRISKAKGDGDKEHQSMCAPWRKEYDMT